MSERPSAAVRRSSPPDAGRGGDDDVEGARLRGLAEQARRPPPATKTPGTAFPLGSRTSIRRGRPAARRSSDGAAPHLLPLHRQEPRRRGRDVQRLVPSFGERRRPVGVRPCAAAELGRPHLRARAPALQPHPRPGERPAGGIGHPHPQPGVRGQPGVGELGLLRQRREQGLDRHGSGALHPQPEHPRVRRRQTERPGRVGGRGHRRRGPRLPPASSRSASAFARTALSATRAAAIPLPFASTTRPATGIGKARREAPPRASRTAKARGSRHDLTSGSLGSFPLKNIRKERFRRCRGRSAAL